MKPGELWETTLTGAYRGIPIRVRRVEGATVFFQNLQGGDETEDSAPVKVFVRRIDEAHQASVGFTIKLPLAADELGRWLESHGATLSISCTLGTYHVTVEQKKLQSYSDEHGKHSEHWEVSRYNRDPMVALEGALRAAGALS